MVKERKLSSAPSILSELIILEELQRTNQCVDVWSVVRSAERPLFLFVYHGQIGFLLTMSNSFMDTAAT